MVPAAAKNPPLIVIPVRPAIGGLKSLTVTFDAGGGDPMGVAVYPKLENSRLPTMVELPSRAAKVAGSGTLLAWAVNPPKASRPTARLEIKKRLVMEPP